MGNIGPCITDNGAVITDCSDGGILWEATLPTDYANKILGMVRESKLIRVSCDTGPLDNPTAIPVKSKVRKISVHDIPPEVAEELISKVEQELKDVVGVKAASYEGDHLVDLYFSDKYATKSYAVRKLAEILGITTNEIIGIGDGHNDLALLTACGLKVAMGNAVEELKAIADYIAPSVSEDGISEIIQKYYFS